jgi:basic membrane lipoprotein Med (substrate-binding protein (PBP1-ABC) superfamily)
MDGMYAGIKIYNEKKSADVKAHRLGRAAQTALRRWRQPLGDPAKGEQLAKTFLDQGADNRPPRRGRTGNGTIKAMLAAGKWAIGVDTDQASRWPSTARRS